MFVEQLTLDCLG